MIEGVKVGEIGPLVLANDEGTEELMNFVKLVGQNHLVSPVKTSQ